ncbi:hypothetical protein [Natrinema versiforme]|uniref:Uncharacterized protein n=1 Tax=Natrinema versiforme JCM 10478 TaxID=1227496 RepID=L9Y655_9EURY|nr:hypothetical protein [Natrinema versiforme]ELY69535.1 hypothetical protein C489_04541 [Natrinema versiforme JCM 10478]
MVDSRSDGRAKPASETRRGRFKQWLLLDGDRFVIAAGVAAAFGITYVAFSIAGVAPIADTQPLFYAFSGLISGNFTLITVVVSINQLLLSQELQSPGELESEIEDTVDYREEVEAVSNRPAPAEPSGFLRLVVESARRDAQRLGGAAVDGLSADAREEIDEIVTDLTGEFDRIDGLVAESDAGIFNTLSTMLETNFAHEIQRLEEFRRARGDESAADTDEAIDDLLNRLRELDIARQYFKSVYLQVELSRLSRSLFYAGIPAVGTAIAALFVMTVPSGPPFGRTVRAVVFPIVVAVGVFPLAVLFSYILRTATVTERTAAITPFTTPEQEV